MVEFKDIYDKVIYKYNTSSIDEAIQLAQQQGDFVEVKHLRMYNKGGGWTQYECDVVGDGWMKMMFVMVK